MVTSRELLTTWSFRLDMQSRRREKWSPSLRDAVEALIGRLKALPPNEQVEIDADMNRNPCVRFIRNTTGEVLGVFSGPWQIDEPLS